MQNTTVEFYLDDKFLGKDCVTNRYEFMEQFKQKEKTIKNFTMDRLKLKPVKKIIDFNKISC